MEPQINADTRRQEQGECGKIDAELLPVKIQFLGDSRDAFRWDLLHWLCSRSAPPFSKLLFVPLLTPPDPSLRHGQTPHTRFPARPEIQDFVGSLRAHPEGLNAIRRLGRVETNWSFDVVIHAPDTVIHDGIRRGEYWRGLQPPLYGNTLLFLDPDNGFEIKSDRGNKWVLDAEVAWLLCELPPSSIVVVFQHWPHRPWNQVFEALLPRLPLASYASAAYDHSSAFILLARDLQTAGTVDVAVRAYAHGHPTVHYKPLKPLANRGAGLAGRNPGNRRRLSLGRDK